MTPNDDLRRQYRGEFDTRWHFFPLLILAIALGLAAVLHWAGHPTDDAPQQDSRATHLPVEPSPAA